MEASVCSSLHTAPKTANKDGVGSFKLFPNRHDVMLWRIKPASVSTAVNHGEYIHRKTKCMHGQVKPLPGRARQAAASDYQIHFGNF